jgi:hypothetical protein
MDPARREAIERLPCWSCLTMNVEADFGASEMRAVAKASERGGINIVPARTQQRGYFLPTPAAKPGWMNQHESPFVASLRLHARCPGKRCGRKRGAGSRSPEGTPARKMDRRRFGHWMLCSGWS